MWCDFIMQISGRSSLYVCPLHFEAQKSANFAPQLGNGATLNFGGSDSTSNTMSPGPRLTSVPSGILIHPAVWPQRTWAENWGQCPFFFGGGALPHLRQCGLGRGLPPSQVSSRSIQLFGHNTPALQTDRLDSGPIA